MTGSLCQFKVKINYFMFCSEQEEGVSKGRDKENGGKLENRNESIPNFIIFRDEVDPSNCPSN